MASFKTVENLLRERLSKTHLLCQYLKLNGRFLHEMAVFKKCFWKSGLQCTAGFLCIYGAILCCVQTLPGSRDSLVCIAASRAQLALENSVPNHLEPEAPRMVAWLKDPAFESLYVWDNMETEN